MNDGSRELATSTAPAGLRKASSWPAGTSVLRALFEALGQKTAVTFRVELIDGSVYQNRAGVPHAVDSGLNVSGESGQPMLNPVYAWSVCAFSTGSPATYWPVLSCPT